jgi:hypothetical protein
MNVQARQQPADVVVVTLSIRRMCMLRNMLKIGSKLPLPIPRLVLDMIMKTYCFQQLALTTALMLVGPQVMLGAELPRDRLLYLIQSPPESHALADAAVFRSFLDRAPTSPALGTELCLLEVPLAKSRLRIKNIQAEGETKHIYETSIPDGSVGAITGGFFGLDISGKMTPIGFVKNDGVVKNPASPWQSGGFIVAGQFGASIVPIRSFKDDASIKTALQSKPLLVEQGKNGIHTATYDRFDRSAIAITSDGYLLLVVIHEPGGRGASLAELSFLLTKIMSRDGGHVIWAIAMDGGPGAHLYVPALKRHCGDGEPNYFPNIIYIKNDKEEN